MAEASLVGYCPTTESFAAFGSDRIYRSHKSMESLTLTEAGGPCRGISDLEMRLSSYVGALNVYFAGNAYATAGSQFCRAASL